MSIPDYIQTYGISGLGKLALYDGTIFLGVAALILAAVCALLLWRRQKAPAEAVSGVERGGEAAETGGGEPPRRRGKALPRLLAGSLVVAVVCGLCLLTGAVQSPWAETFEVSQRDGTTYVTYGPRLLPQSAFGSELDPVRDIIVEQFVTYSPPTSLLPSYWSQCFEAREEVEQLLGFSLPDNAYLEAHGQRNETSPWNVAVLGTKDGQIVDVRMGCRLRVDGLPLLINILIYCREARTLDAEETVFEYQAEELFKTASGRQAFFPLFNNGGTKTTAVLPWDGITFSLIADDTPEGREMLRRVLDGFS